MLCNGGMAMQLALLYLLDCGSSERPIDFTRDYRSSWLGIAVMSAFACCNGDTWASEIGSVIGTSNPILITTRKRVPRGTNGGVTPVGLLVRYILIMMINIWNFECEILTGKNVSPFFSFFGGIAIGLSYYLVVIYVVDRNILIASTKQWPIILFGGIAGLVGSIIDSFLGATVQYSGLDSNGQVVEHPGANVKHISGYRLLDNHSVNLISSILTALIMPFVAMKFWIL